METSKYLTSIEALNYHHYDWHKGSIDYTKQYPIEVKLWCDWGIENSIANPIRAYLDYLYYNIKFLKRIPNMKIDMFLFNDNEIKEINQKINTKLKPKLDKDELELLNIYKDYLKGGKYDFRSKLYTQRKAQRERLKDKLLNGKDFVGKIKIYNIDSLMEMKLNAMENRTTARDLYDISYILTKYQNDLTTKTKNRIIQKFTGIDFMDLALSYEAAFIEDNILKESDLFRSVTRLSEGMEKIIPPKL